MRERLSYANVMATVAVFLALGGGAYALQGRNTVGSDDIRPNAARGVDVAEDTLAKVPNANKLDGIDSSGFVLGRGNARGSRAFIPNATTTPETLIVLPGFGRITANCPEGALPVFTFTNQTASPVEIAQAAMTGNDQHDTVAPDASMQLGGGAETPRLIVWRFARDGSDAMATVWPVFEKPGVGSNCYIWAQALVTR